MLKIREVMDQPLSFFQYLYWRPGATLCHTIEPNRKRRVERITFEVSRVRAQKANLLSKPCKSLDMCDTRTLWISLELWLESLSCIEVTYQEIDDMMNLTSIASHTQ
jgi:hypothetical protein